MALSRKQREKMIALCGEIHEEDGIHPREFFHCDGANRRKNDYATLRLCAQVRQTLELTLSGVLSEIGVAAGVASVAPAPDASRLLVSVLIEASANQTICRTIEARLAEATPWLRSEVASAITRRKAPALSFALVQKEAPYVQD